MRRKLILSLVAVMCLFLLAYVIHEQPSVDTISVHIGKSYKDVERDSTFPVRAKTAIYPSEPPEVDSTWISSPVIVKFDDPKYGFTLPPTKFGAVGYNNEKVSTITTSPMLDTLRFDQLIPLLNHLQEMFKSSGWVPRDSDDHAWLMVSNEDDRNTLQSLLFDQVVVVMLLVPHKYGLALNVKCYARCDERDPKTAKYLIDVSVGADYYSE
ncbi:MULTISPECIES: hypothetical protein [Pseudomonas]|jgi:hypothetical protein|uniref:Uncharacterized protein n=1 Tax=Pseudomonas fluorescens TaxID=294 RepID=A0A5E7J645_PSEFL|nr:MULTISPECIES: hypothetical protein [Pseudomonas]EJM13650.1 hypothetical protein PMI22_04964 [Pseudomonas sp. GM21]MDR6925247.1 hypothetical protein [Pseudomonas sp. BE134]VVO83454.1 hypothetical protein PS880_01925 [Pseudomonas fluorescens]